MRTLVLAALVASALAGPTGQRSTCALHCNQADKYAYVTGSSYMYEYSVTTSTALLGTYDDDAHLHITANAHIDVSAPCEYVLRLTDVGLDGSSHGAEFAAAVTKSPLRFAFQDGHVESLCSEVSEPAWVLNFKRGVLSTFQNSMAQQGIEEVEETDISGMCKTHYNTTVEGDVVTIDKVKDLASCTHRPDLGTYIPSSGYVTDSPIQSLPLFKSNNKCQQRVEEGVLKMAECEETHVFRPFSSDKGGAVTTAKTTMFLSTQGRAAPTPDFEFKRNSLTFEQTKESSKTQIEVVEKVLADLEAASHGEILASAPGLFATLVSSLKELNYPELTTIYNNAKEAHSRKFVIDAMPLVGSAAAFGVFRDMFNNGEILDSEADAFFTSLAFLKNPTSEMFTALAPLLENSPSQKAMLGTSALINTFCKLNTDCESDSGIEQVIRRIETQLGSGCRTTNEEEKVKVLVALKALGNAGHFVNANSVLRRCYTEENNMEVRVAAIEAWRHTPCEYDRSHLLAAFQDENQDTEIRIAAYLALMTCPNPSLIDTIKDRLTSEGVNQVGSFIWTHMTNMQESAAPGKQFVRQMIGEELLQKKFSTEALKFSRNYESSFFMNELNAGAAVESNVIFSSKSFLPRSAMFNLTLDLFGQSINFFEVGGRIEGFEAYVERFFGPNGYYPEETIEAIVSNMRRNSDGEETTLESFLDKVTDEPEGSYYLKMFGNELHYHHFKGLENLIAKSGASSPLEFLMDLARKGDVDYTKSYQLMDTEITIPTVTGLPLTLSAKGTATLGMRMNGNFKANSFSNVNIEGHFHPSAAIQIDGVMAVDAHVSRTGIKLSSNLHTSTFVDGKIQINGGKLVDIAFNTPKDKMEVINVNSEFFFIEDDQEIKKDIDTRVEEEACTSGMTGMALCGGFSYTPSTNESPRFPFSGPQSLRVFLKKTDTITGYILRFSREENQINFLFDTPGSQSSNRLSLSLTKNTNEIMFDLVTPLKSIQGSGEYTWQKNNKNAKVTFTLDKTEIFTVETGIRINRQPTLTIQSFLTYSTPALGYSKIEAFFEGKESEYNFNIDTEGAIQSSFKSNFGFGENFISYKLDGKYATAEGEKPIHQTAVVKKEVNNDLTTYSFGITHEAEDLFNVNNFELDLKTLLDNKQWQMVSKLVVGPETWNAEELWSYTNEDGHYDINARWSLNCPARDLDYSAKYQLQFAQNYLNSEYNFQWAPEKEMVLNINLNKHDDVEATAKIELVYDDLKQSLEMLIGKIADGHYKAQLISTYNTDTQLIEGTLKNNSTPGKINAVIETHIKAPGTDYKATLGMIGDMEKANIDLKVNLDDKEYNLNVAGTRTSILIDSNIFKHIMLDAQVMNNENMQKLHVSAEWDKEVNPMNVFVITGQLTPQEVKAEFKYGEKIMSAQGLLVDNGMEMEAKWASDKRVYANVKYTLGNTKSLAVTVETPFQGWEKQDTTVSVTLKENEIKSSFSATWNNMEQMSLSVNASVQPGLFTNVLNTKVSFTSSFENFERITFSLDHNMADSTINTNMVGIWGQSKMEGHFNLIPNNDGLDARVSFTSPLTENVLVTLHHVLANKEISTTIEAKYGAEISTASLKGHFDNSQVSLSLKVETPVTAMPEIDVNINYTLNDESLNILAEGKIGEKKINLNINGELTVTGDSTSIVGDLRFLTPFTYPLTVTLKHTHDLNQFTSQFEMTRIWSTYGSIKVLAQGNFISKEDIELSLDVSSPVTKGSLSFNHKIVESKMTSYIDVSLNGEKIAGSINGILDASQSLVDIETGITSTFEGIDNIKLHLDSKVEGNTRTSNVVLRNGTKSFTVDHVITISDMYNWENSFSVNNMFKLQNKQSFTGTVIVHDLEYTWDGQTVHITGTLDNKCTESERLFDAQVQLATPWTEDMKLDMHYQDNGIEYKPTIKFEYKPGMIVEYSTILKIEPNKFYNEATLTTPFDIPLSYKLTVEYSEKLNAELTLIGATRTTLSVSGIYEYGKLNGDMKLESDYMPIPIQIKAMYDIISPVKTFNLEITKDKKYALSGTLSGNAHDAMVSLMLQIPASISKIGFECEYHVLAMPYNANVKLMLNDETYEINGKINPGEIQINVDLNNTKGSLTSNWRYDVNYAEVNIDFQSPFSTLDNMAVSGSYDLRNEKKVFLKLTRGSQEINFSGKLEGQTLVLEGATPFSGWETLRGSFFVSRSAINAFVSRNDRKIEVNGSLHVKAKKGKINLTITTPYVGFETIAIDNTYNLQGDVKTIELKATFGSEEVSLMGNINTNSILKPEMSLTIVTPFEAVKTLGGEAHWDMESLVKKAEIKAYRNDRQYEWNLETAADSPLKAYAKTMITSPIEGWSNIKIEGNFDCTKMPCHALFTFEKDGVIKTFEGSISVANNAISADIKTPVTGWETISINGDYGLEGNQLTGNIEIVKTSEKYEIHGSAVMNIQMPNLHVSIKSPVTYASEIELDLIADLTGTQKEFNVQFTKNGETYSFKFVGQMVYKIGMVKLTTTSPITGFTSMDIDAKYDFTGDVKAAELNLMKEGVNQHISVAARVNNNNFQFEIETPFSGFETIMMEGDYTYNNNKHNVMAAFEKDNQKYEVYADVTLDTNSVSLTLATPIDEVRQVAIFGSYKLIDNGLEGSLTFERNNEKFEFNTLTSFTPLKSVLHLSLETPVEGWNNLALDFKYDLLSAKKSTEVLVKKNNWQKRLSVETSFTLSNGSFKVETPVEGFEVLGVEYTLSMDDDYKKLDASVKISQNNNEWTFGAYGQYSESSILIKFQTPFEGFNTIAIEGNINFDQKVGEGSVEFGEYKFTTTVTYSQDNMSFRITTPFEILKIVSMAMRYTYSTSQKDAVIEITYNENTYTMNGMLQLSPWASEFSFKATTPFPGFEDLSTVMKYDLTVPEKQASVEIKVGEHDYNFSIDSFVQEKVAVFKVNLKSPFLGWTEAKFQTKLDLTNDDKQLEIILEKEGNMKVIKINGKYIGDTLDFNLTSPFSGLNNFNIYGSLNRNKRSVEFRMMNDAGEASLMSNFHSLNLHLKTPYANAEDMQLSISQSDEGNFNLEWRRNGNFANIEIDRKGKKNSFDLKINSEFDGPISGGKITVSGSGSFDTSGEFTMNIVTPHANYATVSVELKYNTRKKSLDFEASSSSSDFHVKWSRTKAGIEGHLMVPNSQQNTEISINLTPQHGKITITSRFAFVRNYQQEYNINMGRGEFSGNHIINLNGNEIFKMEFEYNSPQLKTHVQINVNVGDRHTTIHFHREAFNTIHFIFKREVSGVEKHFKIDVTGTGELPQKGTFDIQFENTFGQSPNTVSAHLEVDRTAAQKKLKLELNPTPSRLYVFDLEYNADLKSPRDGEFNLRVTTPNRRAYPWQNISGNWNIVDPNNAQVTFIIGQTTYTANGKLTLRESTLVLSSPGNEDIYFQWKFQREGATRDYFLKLGRVSRYGLLKLKGTIIDIGHVEVEGGFKAGPYMAEEFLFTSKWDETNGAVTGQGTFNYGSYNGDHRLVKFERNAEARSATFEWILTSNIPEYETVTLSGSYDFYNKAVVHVVVQAGSRKSEIDINISDVNPIQSRNTILVSIPLLGDTYGRTELTFSHDFSNQNRKMINAVAKFGARESLLNVRLNKTAGFEKIDGILEIKSRFVGDITINMNYDITNIADAHSEINYSRTTTDNNNKTFNLKWLRKSSEGSLQHELNFDSNFNTLSHARVYGNANYGNNFKLDVGLEWNNKKISYALELRKSQINATLITPFQGFEHIDSNIQYKLTGKEKSIVGHYARGDNVIDINIAVNFKSKKEGSFVVNLTSPFDVVKNLHIEGEWKDRQAHVNYQRNDVQMNFDGVADIKTENSSFDISFTPPSGQKIRIAAAYDVQEFIEGTGSEEKEIANVGLEFEGQYMNLNLQGYRNNDRLNVMVHGSSSFTLLRTFHLKLDSGLNTQKRDGTFEITFNDFDFKMHNEFERRENDGYYFKSKMESSLTPLPALIIGIGRENDDRIITIGYGDNKEITFSIKGKNNFLSGFGGKVDIPDQELFNLIYDVNYTFEGDNTLKIKVNIDMHVHGNIEADFVMNADGVKAALTSPLTGAHIVRVRRSLSSDGFFAEAVLDDFNVNLRGGFKNEDFARGLLLEGEVFGKKFLIDTLFQSEGKTYTEGKLIIITPFTAMEKMGGLFTWANNNNKIMSHAELHLPFTSPIVGEISMDLDKRVKGFVEVEFGSEEFRFQCDLSGSSLSEGYHGDIQVYSPFHTMSDLKINGDIKFEPLAFLETQVQIMAPLANHELKLKYQLIDGKVTGHIMFDSTRIYNPIDVDFEVEGFEYKNLRAEITVNNNKINTQSTIADSTFVFKLGTEILGKDRTFALEAKYPSLENIEGLLEIKIEEETHKLGGNFNINNNHIQGGLELQSTLIAGVRKVVFDIATPNASYKNILLNLKYVSTQTHAVHFELDLRTGIRSEIEIESPLFPKTLLNINLTGALAEITIETPSATHMVKATWRTTRRMPSDWVASLELQTPLLPESYKTNVVLGGRHIKAQFQAGEIMHSLEASASMTQTGGALSFEIETPFNNINKATLQASLNFDNDVEMEVTANFADKTNTFKFVFEKENRKFLATLNSSLIPTGLAEVEAAMTGSNNDMMLEMTMRNRDEAISGTLNIKVNSSQDIDTNLKIITPFNGFKKMTFGAKYYQGETTNIAVFADKPLNFKAELSFGNTDDMIKADALVETPIVGFEKVQAEITIPLYEFAPHMLVVLPEHRYGFSGKYDADNFSQNMLASVTLDDDVFRGSYMLRSKAPYEVAYDYYVTEYLNGKFHLRTDSSFMSVFF